jgi:hypothetical protein
MSEYKIFTYATHEQGKFSELIRNNGEIIVLGFGKKWNGFMDKFKALFDALKTEDDDTIIVFLDGFDSIICGSTDDAIKKYTELFPTLPFLVSYSTLYGVSKNFDDYLNSRVFNGEANSGMYMGPASKVKIVLEKSIQLEKESHGDDQRAMNLALKANIVDYEIDRDKKIFKNLNLKERINFVCNQVSFISEPGELSWRRISRCVVEYTPFFRMEIFIIISLMILIILRKASYSKLRNLSINK